MKQKNIDHLMVGLVIPSAPAGVLGHFIQSRLAAYKEPSRKGTPKGEPIGLSRKKFHAALLALTNIELPQQAKFLKVSYALLRKWRTEEHFLNESIQLLEEFIKHYFKPATKVAFDAMLAHRANLAHLVKGDPAHLALAWPEKQGVPGFEDAGLYSPALIIEIVRLFSHACDKAMKLGNGYDGAMELALPLSRHCHRLSPEKANRLRMVIARLLTKLVERARIHFTDKDEALSKTAMLGSVIGEVLRD